MARPLPDLHDILLVRLDGVGDAVVCVPALEGLRTAFPGARFHIVCSPRNAGIFAPDRVETIVYPAADFEDRITATRFDAAIVATEEVNGYAIARRSQAPRRVGFWHRWEKPFKSAWQRAQLTHCVYRPAAWVRRPEHEVETMYRLAAALGAAPPPPRDLAKLRAWLNVGQVGEKASIGLFGFQVAPKLAAGGWGPAALGRAITVAMERAAARRCALICSAPDERLAQATMEHLGPDLRGDGHAQVLASSSIGAWLGALASVDALVTADTGAAHAAGMIGTPVVDVFENDRFDQLMRRWGPWAAPSRCVQKPAWRAGTEETLGNEVGAALIELCSP